MSEHVILTFPNNIAIRFLKSELPYLKQITFVKGKLANQLSSYHLMLNDLKIIFDCLETLNVHSLGIHAELGLIFFSISKYNKFFTVAESGRSILNADKVFSDKSNLIADHTSIMDFRNSYIAHSDYKYENCSITFEGTKQYHNDGKMTINGLITPHLHYTAKINETEKLIALCKHVEEYLNKRIEKVTCRMIKIINEAIVDKRMLTDMESEIWMETLGIAHDTIVMQIK